MKPGDTLVVEARELDAILDALRRRGHTLVGPTVRDGAIVLDEIDAARRPAARAGPTSRTAGRYRLRRRERRRPLRLRRRAPRLEALPAPAGRGALAGPAREARLRGRARRRRRRRATPSSACAPCELAAIRVQDRVFLGGPFVDPAYRSRREAAFVSR